MKFLEEPTRPCFRRPDAVMAIVGVMALLVLVVATCAWTKDIGDPLTRNAVRLALAWYAASLFLMMKLKDRDWRATTSLGRYARWCWTWGAVCFLVHVAMAFHFFHHWSHADAFARTRQVGGIGEGIFASYLFTLLWPLDAAAWWLCPSKYAVRPTWIDRLLHSFLAFMVFNGSVVFAVGIVRWTCLAVGLVLAACWVASRPSRDPTCRSLT